MEELFEEYPFFKRFCEIVHGSGINFDWEVEVTRRSVILKNAYHAMDENGHYDRIVPFTIVFSKQSVKNYKIRFRANRRYAIREGILDYLDCLVYDAIEWCEENK